MPLQPDPRSRFNPPAPAVRDYTRRRTQQRGQHMSTATTNRLAGYFSTPELAEWARLPDWRARRELEYCEAAGVVRLARVGRYRLLPESELDNFRGWLERRGLLPQAEPQTVLGAPP